ncbi:MAG: hypothetical protein ACK559_20430, partial [bacterium]
MILQHLVRRALAGHAAGGEFHHPRRRPLREAVGVRQHHPRLPAPGEREDHVELRRRLRRVEC